MFEIIINCINFINTDPVLKNYEGSGFEKKLAAWWHVSSFGMAWQCIWG
jgi:hypothetical protein